MEILLHPLGLGGRQLKPTETCNDPHIAWVQEAVSYSKHAPLIQWA